MLLPYSRYEVRSHEGKVACVIYADRVVTEKLLTGDPFNCTFLTFFERDNRFIGCVNSDHANWMVSNA